MFGNRIGWLLSVGILVMVGMLLFLIHQRAQELARPGPVGAAAASFTMKVPVDPRSVATWMTREGDAVAIYKRMIDLLDENQLVFRSFDAKPGSEDVRKIQGILDLLIEARDLKGPGVFADRPQEMISYDFTRPAVRMHIPNLRSAAWKLASGHIAAGQNDKARQLHEAIYTLGVKLYEERMVYDEWAEGRICLSSAWYLSDLATDPAEKAAFKKVDDQFKDFYYERMEAPHRLVPLIDPDPRQMSNGSTITFRSGLAADLHTWTRDMIALAQGAGDVMWRTEATLALGRARFKALTKTDQRRAEFVLKQLANDPEPNVRLAAQAALALTEEQERRTPPAFIR